MRFLLKLLAANVIILLAPLILVAAAINGSEDEQWLAVRLFWVCFPLTVILWTMILSFWRRVHGKA